MKVFYLSVSALALLGTPGLVHAEEGPASPASAVVQPQTQVAPTAAPSTDPAPLSLSDLDGISAGTDTSYNVITNQQLTATNSGNMINAVTVTNGNISFAGNALSGYNGVGNFVMNTGNNNNLQGSVNVSVNGVPSGL